MSDLSVDRPTGDLRPGWFAEVDDYAIAGGWTARGEALVVGDAAGGVYAFDGTSGATIWAQPGAHQGGVLAVAIHPSRARVRHGWPGRPGPRLECRRRSGQPDDRGRKRLGRDTWRGRRTASGWRPPALGRFAPTVRMAWKPGDPLIIPAPSARSRGPAPSELATACYGRVTFFEASTGEPRQKLEWMGSLVSMVMSPDGEIVACGSQDNSVHFWRRSTEKDAMMSGYPAKPSALAFDGTGTLLATGGGDEVTVWSFQGKGPEGTRPGCFGRSC